MRHYLILIILKTRNFYKYCGGLLFFKTFLLSKRVHIFQIIFWHTPAPLIYHKCTFKKNLRINAFHAKKNRLSLSFIVNWHIYPSNSTPGHFQEYFFTKLYIWEYALVTTILPILSYIPQSSLGVKKICMILAKLLSTYYKKNAKVVL